MAFRFNPTTGQLDVVSESGPSGPSSTIVSTQTAQETISALKVVRAGVFIASPTSTYENARALGVAITSATTGNPIQVLEFGELQDPTFVFSAGSPLFLGALGTITDIAPAVGFSVKIGYALGSNKIQVDLLFPIQL